MRKKITAIGFALLMFGSISTGCGAKSNKQVVQDTTEVVTTTEAATSVEETTEEATTEAITEEETTEELTTTEEENTTECLSPPADIVPGEIDVDLTKLSSTMVYSEVYNMMMEPSDYIGKTVRMKGPFAVYTNMDQTVFYPAIIIADATACCAQGIEFTLEGNPQYPAGYPDLDEITTVKGVFETYEEDGYTYCRLANAVIE